MHLLVGLGNPGGKYARHRHNVGFMVLDAIRDRHGFPAYRAKFSGEVSEGALAGEKVLLLKPGTYMNLSGQSVAAAKRFYKLEPEDITVIHDELDLAPGKIRVKAGGGFAGHNGLKSIAQHLGPDFRRLRIGIGHPGDKDRVTGHVLTEFAKSDFAWLDGTIDAVAEAAPLLVTGAAGDFTTKVALILGPPAGKKPATGADSGESGG